MHPAGKYQRCTNVRWTAFVGMTTSFVRSSSPHVDACRMSHVTRTKPQQNLITKSVDLYTSTPLRTHPPLLPPSSPAYVYTTRTGGTYTHMHVLCPMFFRDGSIFDKAMSKNTITSFYNFFPSFLLSFTQSSSGGHSVRQSTKS